MEPGSNTIKLPPVLSGKAGLTPERPNINLLKNARPKSKTKKPLMKLSFTNMPGIEVNNIDTVTNDMTSPMQQFLSSVKPSLDVRTP